MNLLDIAKTVGAAAFSVAVPGGAAILAAVNQMLPEGSKLPETATGHDIRGAVSSLPPAQQAAVLEKEFDVELTQIKEAHSTARAMLQAEASSTHTTRPYIAKGSFQLVASVSLLVVSLWCYAVGVGKVDMVAQIMDGWPFVAAILLPFIVLLKSYFGVLEREHRNRLGAATGVSTPSAIAGIIQAFVKK